MRIILVALSFCLMSSGCATTVAQSNAPVKISNFKVGYVCPASPGDPNYNEYPGQTSGITGGTICKETTQIVITDSQDCIFNRKSSPCTWYGYEFEYENMPKGASLSCLYVGSHPAMEGNPEGIRTRNLAQEEFSLEIEAGNGRFYNPLYTLAPNSVDVAQKQTYATACKLGDQKIFEYELEVTFAVGTAKT